MSVCTGVFACVLLCVGYVKGLMEFDIYRRGVELGVLVCRGCYSLYK